jgi:hypothetical protein
MSIDPFERILGELTSSPGTSEVRTHEDAGGEPNDVFY